MRRKEYSFWLFAHLSIWMVVKSMELCFANSHLETKNLLPIKGYGGLNRIVTSSSKAWRARLETATRRGFGL